MERPVDENFIRLMETKLTSGRRKGRVGWDNNWHCKWPTNDPMSALFKGLLNEVIELRLAMENKTAVDIGYEAADIANYAMFIADYAGSLEPPKELPSYKEMRGILNIKETE